MYTPTRKYQLSNMTAINLETLQHTYDDVSSTSFSGLVSNMVHNMFVHCEDKASFSGHYRISSETFRCHALVILNDDKNCSVVFTDDVSSIFASFVIFDDYVQMTHIFNY